MKKSNLWKIFRKIEHKERKQLQLFLSSPFFNVRKDVLQLFLCLQKGMSNHNFDLRKETLFKKIYPKEVYDSKKMSYLMSFLLKEIKRFLVFRHLEERPELSQIFLCQSILDKGEDALFEKEWATAKKLLEQTTIQGGYSHLRRFQLHEVYYEYFRKKARLGDMHLQEISDELTNFYLIQTLRQRCLMLSHQTMAEKQYEQVFFDEVLGLLEQGRMRENFLVNIYYHSYKSITSLEDDSHFNQLVELIEEYWENISEKEIRDIYTLAINYCIKKVNKGEKVFFEKALHLYKSGLERKILLEKGILSRFTYKNISAIGFGAKQIDWVLAFLEDYKKHLHPSERRNTYQYNLAIYHFRLSNYEDALELLRDVEFKNDVFYNLDIRRMLLRIYYELGHYMALSSLLDSFSTYINRNKKLGYHRENYMNLIKIVKLILRSNIKNKKEKEIIIEKINNMESLAERNWLLDILSR